MPKIMVDSTPSYTEVTAVTSSTTNTSTDLPSPSSLSSVAVAVAVIKPLVDVYIQLWFGRNVMERSNSLSSSSSQEDEEGITPLLEAVQNGDESSVFMILLHIQHNFFDEPIYQRKLLNVQDPKTGNTPLHCAIERCNNSCCDENNNDDLSLSSSMSLISSSSSSSSSEHHNHVVYSSIVQLLLDYNNNINNHQVEEPLQQQQQQQQLVNVNSTNREGITPLHLASHIGQEWLVRQLLHQGANIYATEQRLGMTPLHYATQKGHLGVVRLLLLEEDEEEESTTRTATINAGGTTSSSRGGRSMVDFGAIGTGFTPLHFAAQGNLLDMAQLLVCDYGANIHSCDRNNRTPLHVAALKGYESMVQLLLQYGANLWSTGPKFNALQVASYCGHESVVQIILSSFLQKVDKNKKVGIRGEVQQQQQQQQHQPSKEEIDKKEELERLVNARVGDGSSATALYLASWNGHHSIVQLLLEQGKADINVMAGNHKWTSLHVAAIGGKKSVVEVLLQQGANRDAIDKHGWTPIQWAKRRDHESIIRLLQQEEEQQEEDQKQQNRHPQLLLSSSSFESMSSQT